MFGERHPGAYAKPGRYLQSAPTPPRGDSDSRPCLFEREADGFTRPLSADGLRTPGGDFGTNVSYDLAPLKSLELPAAQNRKAPERTGQSR
jgi:hypothetical protein